MSEPHKIQAFCHIVKASGTTVTMLLRRHFGLGHLDTVPRAPSRLYTPRDCRRDARLMPWLRSLSGHGMRPHVDFRELDDRLVWFTWLRDPVERLVSGYQHGVEKGGYQRGFEQWLSEPRHRNRMVYFLSGSDDDAAGAIEMLEKKMRFVGLVERFDESLLLFRREMGLESMTVDYPRPANPAKRGDTARKIRDELDRYRDLIEYNTEQDQVLYEYARSELFPEYVNRYGAAQLSADRDSTFRRRSPSASARLNETACRLFRHAVYRPVISRL